MGLRHFAWVDWRDHYGFFWFFVSICIPLTSLYAFPMPEIHHFYFAFLFLQKSFVDMDYERFISDTLTICIRTSLEAFIYELKQFLDQITRNNARLNKRIRIIEKVDKKAKFQC